MATTQAKTLNKYKLPLEKSHVSTALSEYNEPLEICVKLCNRVRKK